MRYLTTTLLLLLIFTSCQNTSAEKEAQKELSEKELLAIFNEDMHKYVQLINAKDYDAVVGYMPVKVFDISPKSAIVQQFENLMSMGLDMEMSFFRITEVSEVVTYDGDNYCKLQYDGEIKVTLSGQLLTAKDVFIDAMEQQYNADAKTLADDKFSFKTKQTMYAISVKGSNDWKYVEDNNSSGPLIDQIIPAQVRSDLK